jgi:hypothetical protein
MTVTITPTSATSKIMVMPSLNTLAVSGASSPYAIGWVRLIKDTSTVLNTLFPGIYFPNGGNVNTAAYGSYSPIYVDSPATTSAITYKVQMNNVFGIPTFTANPEATSVQITAMEILI